MTTLPPLLSIVQAAESVGLKPATLRDWRKRQLRGAKLKEDVRQFASQFQKVGTAVRVPSSAIEEFLGNSSAGGSPSLVGGEIGQAMLKVQQEILDELRLIRLERRRLTVA
ncbi:MAG TPA: hypothetical protein VM425_21050 [Myxococcota bacterium]|nr:hypothetical protein [Myxococcota bacterium]